MNNNSINYLNKDFNSFRENLLNYIKVYYKNTYNDIDNNDAAIMFLELSAYIGDSLSYYLDSQLKEMLLLYSAEKQNVYALAAGLGYKPKISIPAIVELEVFQIVPSIGVSVNNLPDYRYALKIKQGMQISSKENSSVVFRTLSEVNFNVNTSDNPTTVSVYQTSGTEPTFYLLKKIVKAQNGLVKNIQFEFNDPIRYKTINISEQNIVGIESAYDSDNNKWYEVNYLAQDTILDSIENTVNNFPSLSTYNSTVPYILKMKYVPKRFITRYKDDGTLDIQFGSGLNSNVNEEIVPNPTNVGLTTPLNVNKLNYQYSVSNFLYTTAYGETPNNTSITFKYIIGNGINGNVISNVLQNVNLVEFFESDNTVDTTLYNYCKQSLTCNNPNPATGGRNTETIDEIRNNALAYFAAQDRCITKDDYIMRCLNMDSKFGGVSKVYVNTNEKTKEHELFILGYNTYKQLTNCNLAIKENLKTYLNQYRILGETVSIKDAFIVNFEVITEISVLNGFIPQDIILSVILTLQDYFNIDKMSINSTINISDVLRTIANVKGVQSVISIKFNNKFDSEEGYSSVIYNLDTATKGNIIYPSIDPMVLEIRFPKKDVICRVKSY